MLTVWPFVLMFSVVLSGSLRGPRATLAGELGDLEGLAVDPVVLERIEARELGPEVDGELPVVHLGHEHLLEALQDLAEVLRERVQPAQVDVADLLALRDELLGGAADRAEGAAPGDERAGRRVFAPNTSTSGTSSTTFRIFCARVFTIRSWFMPS